MIENLNKNEILNSAVKSESSKFDPDKRIEKDLTIPDFDIRNYGIEEASDVAKNIFTPDVFKTEWKEMSEEQRQNILETYGIKVAEVLGIDFKGVCFTGLCDSCFCWGCSEGRGQVFVTPSFLTTPKYLVEAINTISHEIRHEFQEQALKSPEKFNLDEMTKKEWTVAKETYTLAGASELDPFGYEYNALELDARHFGESIINDLQKSMA